jgi:hypothetical protein
MGVTLSEYALIASTSIPRTETSAPETTYGFLARDWEGPRRIKQSLLSTSSSSMQISGGEMRWKDALYQGRESTLLI